MKCEVNACGLPLMLAGVNPDAKLVQVMCRNGHRSEYPIMPEWWPWVQDVAIKANNMSVMLGSVTNPARSMLTTEVYEIAAMAVLAARVRVEAPKEQPKSVEGQLDVFTDGSCHPNPGPGGWGFIIKNSKGEVIDHASVPSPRDLTNNEAEYRGVLSALDACKHIRGVSTVRVHSDSEIVVKQLNGNYAVGKQLKDVHAEVQAMIGELSEAGIALYVEWISGDDNPAHQFAEAAYKQASGRAK